MQLVAELENVMMEKALGFLRQELDQHLQTVSAGGGLQVVVSGLVAADGTVPAGTENKLVLTFVSVEFATGLRPPGQPGPVAEFIPTLPEMHVSALLSSNVQDYSVGLRLLSSAIAFVAANPLLDAVGTPGFPVELQRLTVELNSLAPLEQGGLWQNLGVPLRPAVLLRLRLAAADPKLLPKTKPSPPVPSPPKG